ncbi:protein ALP1-like [Canna indica]|uniref:Protein ALP1-like n=1 Tax=Canna indica TaxID=4628 RepID=A0AAQ3QJG4_9LILI|nr:protein ALP1-like [Canna indica]
MHSGETVSRYFNEVLRAIGELSRELIRCPSLNTHSRITSSSRFMPYFKDCIGALDGTHVHASVPVEHVVAFRGRKPYRLRILRAPESEDNVEFANLEVNVHTNDVSIDVIHAQAHSTQGASLSSEKIKKKSSKRHKENKDDIMMTVVNNIKELAVAIKEYNEPEIFIDGLYEVVMSISGFDKSHLCRAYRMLAGSSTREARAFMVASTHHHYFWIRDMLNM